MSVDPLMASLRAAREAAKAARETLASRTTDAEWAEGQYDRCGDWNKVLASRGERDKAELDVRLADRRVLEMERDVEEAAREQLRGEIAKHECVASGPAWLASIRPDVERLVALHAEARAAISSILAKTRAQNAAAAAIEHSAAALSIPSLIDTKCAEDALLVVNVATALSLESVSDPDLVNGWIRWERDPLWSDPKHDDWHVVRGLITAGWTEPAEDTQPAEPKPKRTKR